MIFLPASPAPSATIRIVSHVTFAIPQPTASYHKAGSKCERLESMATTAVRSPVALGADWWLVQADVSRAKVSANAPVAQLLVPIIRFLRGGGGDGVVDRAGICL